MDLGLRNRVALVAASSQGLGLATAEAFAAERCRVAMCARNQQALAANAERIRKQHKVEVFTDAFDVTDASAVQRFVAAVAGKFGTVDICVTNAGGPPASLQATQAQRVLAAVHVGERQRPRIATSTRTPLVGP